MATYPIKMLRDEQGQPFVPLISLDSVQDADGKSINDLLENKIEVTDIKAGNQIEIETDGNTITINNSAEGMKLINNTDTVVVGEGALDAAQGKVLKDSIPEVVNNLTTIDSKKALSAHQGYVLAGRVAPVGGATGQVLKKASDSDYSFEWGDAADPNAIGGDGTIKKIVELTYEEYQTLEDAGELDDATEYHINNWTESGYSEIRADQVLFGDSSNVQEKINNIDLINEGQNTRLDVAEGNIDTIIGTVNGLSERFASTVETSYLGDNPDINSMHTKSGIYGLYNCSQAPDTGIGVLEVLYYSWDWTIQRFSTVGYGVPSMWERSFYSGTTWGPWTKRW